MKFLGISTSKQCLKTNQSIKRIHVKSTDEYPILFILSALTKGASVLKASKT